MMRISTKFTLNLLTSPKWRISSKLVSRCFSTERNQLVEVEVNENTGIATVTINRPPVNSLNLELFEALSNTLDDLESNHSRGMILTSACPSVFSAGLELKELIRPDVKRFQQFWTACQDVWFKLYGSSFPTAAAINGHAPTGGCFLALSCEYRVMCPGYKIGLNETRLGIGAPIFLVALMRNTLSNREAERALTLGKLFTSDEALKVGLIDEIAFDKPTAVERCEDFLMQFKHIPQFARSHTKRIFRKKDLEELKYRRDEDLQTILSNITQPSVQKQLQEYFVSLKRK